MTWTKGFFQAFVFLCMFTSSQAWSGLSLSDLEGPVQDFLTESRTPGVSVAVLEKGQDSPLTISRGMACPENAVPVTDQTVMKMGSVTKVFTGIRIKMLIEAGKLDNDTPISRFFPEFPRGAEIRIRHLLTHTSGLPEMLALESILENLSKPWNSREIMDLLARHPLDFTPGTAQKYSNSGYYILGLIIEAVTEESYAKQIVEKVAIPLGMRHVRVGDDTSIVPGESCGYSADKQGALSKPMMASIIPAMATGNLMGTAEDIVRLVNQGRLIKDNLIDAPRFDPFVLDNGHEAQKAIRLPGLSYDQSLESGMTTFCFRDRTMNLIGKDGMFPGFAAWFLYDPETGTAVAVVLNQETTIMDAMRMVLRIFEKKRQIGK